VYYHLTRLGYPPILLSEENVVSNGIPDSVHALVVVRQRHPLEPAVAEATRAFMKKGGKVLATSDTAAPIEGAIVIQAKVKHIWNFSGFQRSVHREMWEEFQANWRAPLAAALAEAGLKPMAETNPDLGLALGMAADPVRYAALLADPTGSVYGQPTPIERMPVSLEGEGWIVGDLARQQTLETTSRQGRTETSVSLVSEPCTLLALFRSPPAKLRMRRPASAVCGETFSLSCRVLDAAGRDMGPVPVAWQITDPAGNRRAEFYAAAGEQAGHRPATRDIPGRWKARVQELLTGLAAETFIEVAAPAATKPSLTPCPQVHVVNAAHLAVFASRKSEKVIVVEPGRREILPIARKLADSLTGAGVKARLWEAQPEDFNTIPMRYYPRPDEAADIVLIEAGKLIGWRENMKPWIDARKKANIPSKGGTTEIPPYFMVGCDSVLFSGGPLSESLRCVTPWMDTPSVPGIGQARLLVVFSPFMADRHATVLIAHDIEGWSAAANRLVSAIAGRSRETTDGKNREPALSAEQIEEEPQPSQAPVPTPLAALAPPQRVVRLLAAPSGKACVLLNHLKADAVFVSPDGKPGAALRLPDHSPQDALLENDGSLWTATFERDENKSLSTVFLRRYSPTGGLSREIMAYSGASSELGPFGGHGSFAISPDGRLAAFGRSAGLLLGRPDGGEWTWYDDMPHVKRTFEVWTPRFPVALAFSPDSCRLFFTMDTRPIGYENMHQRLNRPEGAESVLLDTSGARRVWSLRGEPADFACAAGFAAVSASGKVTALVDVFGRIALVDASGKVMNSLQAVPKSKPNGFCAEPPDGVGAAVSGTGSLAVFGFRTEAILGSTSGFVRLPAQDLVSVAVMPRGEFAVWGGRDGTVKACDPAGRTLWQWNGNGLVPAVACASNAVLVALSDGSLTMLDVHGGEIRRINMADIAESGGLEPRPSSDFIRIEVPWTGREPGTLEIARRRLGARRVAAWKDGEEEPDGHSHVFRPIQAGTTLSAPENAGNILVHFVYRRPASNKRLVLAVQSGGSRHEFVLDLPTPGFRTVDIPARGPPIKVTVECEGPVEAADFSLWQIEWPGPNVAYVRPPETGGAAAGGLLEDRAENDIEIDIDGEGGNAAGQMKECRIWSPNPDIDRVEGAFLASPCNPLLAVNGRAWGERVPPWPAQAGSRPFQGAWLSIDFGAPVKISLVATYDRASVQSQVTTRIAVFSGRQGRSQDEAGQVLAAAVENDQFWRLFEFAPSDVSTLGVHVYRPHDLACGLAEVEAYR